VGDSALIPLPAIGIAAATAVQYIGSEQDRRLATYADVPVAITAADFFAGRDPVLAAAMR
jgi:hypothetical protein